MDNQKQIKEYKKKLLSFLLFYCKKNSKFYQKRLLGLSDDGKEQELGALLRDTWVEHNTSIRRDRTGFIDNSLYLEALVNNLLVEIPRDYSDDISDEVDDEYSGEDLEEREQVERGKSDAEEETEYEGSTQVTELEAADEVDGGASRPRKKQKTTAAPPARSSSSPKKAKKR